MQDSDKLDATRHFSRCGQDKPLRQFRVNEENRDATTWVAPPFLQTPLDGSE